MKEVIYDIDVNTGERYEKKFLKMLDTNRMAYRVLGMKIREEIALIYKFDMKENKCIIKVKKENEKFFIEDKGKKNKNVERKIEKRDDE